MEQCSPYLMIAEAVLPAPNGRRQNRPSRRQQGATWVSWPGDPVDFWGDRKSGLSLAENRSTGKVQYHGERDASKGDDGANSGKVAPRGGLAEQDVGKKVQVAGSQGKWHEEAAFTSRSRSDKVRLRNVGAGGSSESCNGDSDSPPASMTGQGRRGQKSSRQKANKEWRTAKPKGSSSRAASVAEPCVKRLLWCLLVWGNAVATCCLLVFQWGGYAGRYERHPCSGMAGAWAVLAVPLTYTLGGSLRFQRQWHAWQPFQGGPRFVLLQAAAWFFWAWALAPFLMPLVAELPAKTQAARCWPGVVPNLPAVHLAFSALACAIAQLATSMSLHVFVPHSRVWPPQLRLHSSARRRPLSGSPLPRAATLWAQSKRCYRAVIGVNLSLATLLCGVAAVADVWLHWPALSPALPTAGPSSQQALVAGVCCASLAVIGPATYGLGGSLRYRPAWAFWQPFVGGLSFVVIQALAWAMFAAALAAFLLAAYCATALTSSRLGNGLLATAGFGGLASEVLMAASLLCYVAPVSGQRLKGSAVEHTRSSPVLAPRRPRDPVSEQARDSPVSYSPAGIGTAVSPSCDGSLMAVEAACGLPIPLLPPPASTKCALLPSISPIEALALPAHWLAQQARNKTSPPGALAMATQSAWAHAKVYSVLVLFYCNHLFVISGILLPWVLLGWRGLAAPLLLFLLYLPTYRGSPHTTGRRKWEPARKLLGAWLEEVAVHHWGGLRLVRTSKEPLDSTRAYVFGYHPHGLFPVTAAWFHYTSAWRQLFPGIRPVSLAATAVFMAPVLRDLMLWAGNREVSRRGFQNALDDERAVVVCPGGQSELCLHQPRNRRKFVLCARKKGFIRLAMQNGAALVPVFCFGESFMMHNLFDWPAIQRWTYRTVGFPVPFLPVGLFGVLPLPRRGPLAIVVGEPICTRRAENPTVASLPHGSPPSEEEVEAMRVRYFQALAQLFEAHKGKHGYAEFELEFRHG